MIMMIMIMMMIGNQDQTRPVWEVCACDTRFATVGAVAAPTVASLGRKHACKRHIDCKHQSTHTLCLPIARPPPAYGPCDRGYCWEIVEPGRENHWNQTASNRFKVSRVIWARIKLCNCCSYWFQKCRVVRKNTPPFRIVEGWDIETTNHRRRADVDTFQPLNQMG